MKRFIALLLILTLVPGAALLGQASGSDGSDSAEAESPAPREVARQATRDAARDADDFTPSWWGFGGFAASMLISPLIGGGIVTLVGYTVEGDVQVPAMRMVEVEERYGDDYRLLDVYEEEYEDTYGKIKKQRQGGRALLGTGIAFGVYVALYAAILASYLDCSQARLGGNRCENPGGAVAAGPAPDRGRGASEILDSLKTNTPSLATVRAAPQTQAPSHSGSWQHHA